MFQKYSKHSIQKVYKVKWLCMKLKTYSLVEPLSKDFSQTLFLNEHNEASENVVVAVVRDVGGAVLASRVFKVADSPELALEMRFTTT
jgi:hypothetical protein